jgi:hypothetical protein
LLPSYLPVRRQQRLKAAAGATGAQVVAAEFFDEFFLAVNYSRAALHFGFGWIALAALTAALESSVDRCSVRFAWQPPVGIEKLNTNWFCTLPKRKGAALRSLIQLRFVGSRGGNLGGFGFDFLELCRADKAETLIRLGYRGPQSPGDLFHVFLARQSLVLVERAIADRKTDFALDIEGSAKHFFFRGTKSSDDAAARARPAQGFTSFRNAPFDSNRDHDFLFSKKRFNASGCAHGAQTHRGGTPRAVTRANLAIRATMRRILGRSTPE